MRRTGFPGIAARRAKCVVSAGLLVSARLINCVAFNPSHFTSLVHLFIHPVVMTHARACRFVTAHHIVSLPHDLALLARTLSRPISFSHRVTFALAPAAKSHRDRLASSVNVSHRFALFRMHLIVCRATGQPFVQRTDTEPRTVRRTTERTGNIHCCCSRGVVGCHPRLILRES